MKFIFLPILFLAGGCLSQTATTKVLESLGPGPVLIEVNSVPHPFDLNGRAPYVLWVNGVRIDVSNEDLSYFISRIGADNIKPTESQDIHQGWLWPNLANKGKAEHEQKGRVRMVR
jgi:hypothetical protein